jgi:hypothetical protein
LLGCPVCTGAHGIIACTEDGLVGQVEPGMQRQDYIERMIAQITAAIARILGLAKGGTPDEAERELALTWSGMIGLRRTDLERLDGATARAILGEKRVLAAMLLEAEADIRRLQGQQESAGRLAELAARMRA